MIKEFKPIIKYIPDQSSDPSEKILSYDIQNIKGNMRYIKLIIENAYSPSILDSIKSKWLFVSEIEVR